MLHLDENLTEQQVFDAAAEHLLTQGEQSVDSVTNRCLYRGPNGLKCAYGIFVSDEEACAFEGTDVWGLERTGWLPARHLHLAGLFDRLQEVHDYSSPPSWKDRLRFVAGEFSLNTAVLDKFNHN